MKRDASGQILATLFSAVLWWKHWSTLLGRGPPPPCVYSFSFFLQKQRKHTIVLAAKYLNLPKVCIIQQILDKRPSSNNEMRTLPMLDQSTGYKYNFRLTFLIVKQRREANSNFKSQYKGYIQQSTPPKSPKIALWRCQGWQKSCTVSGNISPPPPMPVI